MCLLNNRTAGFKKRRERMRSPDPNASKHALEVKEEQHTRLTQRAAPCQALQAGPEMITSTEMLEIIQLCSQ